MTELDAAGRRLLQLLVSLLPSADPEHPNKMIGYKEAHERLGLKNVRGDWGASLKVQGLNNLAEWTKSSNRPAITGLIVNQQDGSPGKGYYSLFDRPDEDWPWWREQVIASKKYNWDPFLQIGTLAYQASDNQIENLFKRILVEYSDASSQVFAGHALAEVIRVELPAAIASWVDDAARYSVSGSPGKGNWAAVPWVATVDRLVTDSVQAGYYLVYLFCADSSGVHLSLNQGVTKLREQYGAGALQALKIRAQDFSSRLGPLTAGLTTGPIDLFDARGSTLASLYGAGSICSVFYAIDAIPSDEILRNDFRKLIVLYEELAARDDRFFTSADTEDDEQNTRLSP